jgi:hypothetical protein
VLLVFQLHVATAEHVAVDMSRLQAWAHMLLTLSQLHSGSALHSERDVYRELQACEQVLLAPFHMQSLSLEHGVC